MRMWSCLLGPGGLCSSTPKVPDAYTKPTALYGSATSDKIDLKRLKRLIVEGKLAPFFPGLDDPSPSAAPPEQRTLVRKLLKQKGQPVVSSAEPHSLEECPICFMYYPLMNTSRCCAKRVCTDCFLQFLGAITEEAREQDRIEEQKVIEARIREREEEVRRDIERELQRAQERQAQQAAAAAGAAASTTNGAPAPAAAAAAAAGSGQIRAVGAQPTGPQVASGDGGVAMASSQRQAAADHTIGRSEPAVVGRTGSWDASVASGEQQAAGGDADTAWRNRMTDYVPTSVTDISVSVEDINDFMLEQAIYESLVQSGANATELERVQPVRLRGRQQQQARQPQLPALSPHSSAAAIRNRTTEAAARRAQVTAAAEAAATMVAARANGAAGRAARAAGMQQQQLPAWGADGLGSIQVGFGAPSDGAVQGAQRTGGVAPGAALTTAAGLHSPASGGASGFVQLTPAVRGRSADGSHSTVSVATTAALAAAAEVAMRAARETSTAAGPGGSSAAVARSSELPAVSGSDSRIRPTGSDARDVATAGAVAENVEAGSLTASAAYDPCSIAGMDGAAAEVPGVGSSAFATWAQMSERRGASLRSTCTSSHGDSGRNHDSVSKHDSVPHDDYVPQHGMAPPPGIENGVVLPVPVDDTLAPVQMSDITLTVSDSGTASTPANGALTALADSRLVALMHGGLMAAGHVAQEDDASGAMRGADASDSGDSAQGQLHKVSRSGDASNPPERERLRQADRQALSVGEEDGELVSVRGRSVPAAMSGAGSHGRAGQAADGGSAGRTALLEDGGVPDASAGTAGIASAAMTAVPVLASRSVAQESAVSSAGVSTSSLPAAAGSAHALDSMAVSAKPASNAGGSTAKETVPCVSSSESPAPLEPNSSVPATANIAPSPPATPSPSAAPAAQMLSGTLQRPVSASAAALAALGRAGSLPGASTASSTSQSRVPRRAAPPPPITVVGAPNVGRGAASPTPLSPALPSAVWPQSGAAGATSTTFPRAQPSPRNQFVAHPAASRAHGGAGCAVLAPGTSYASHFQPQASAPDAKPAPPATIASPAAASPIPVGRVTSSVPDVVKTGQLPAGVGLGQVLAGTSQLQAPSGQVPEQGAWGNPLYDTTPRGSSSSSVNEHHGQMITATCTAGAASDAARASGPSTAQHARSSAGAQALTLPADPAVATSSVSFSTTTRPAPSSDATPPVSQGAAGSGSFGVPGEGAAAFHSRPFTPLAGGDLTAPYGIFAPTSPTPTAAAAAAADTSPAPAGTSALGSLVPPSPGACVTPSAQSPANMLGPAALLSPLAKALHATSAAASQRPDDGSPGAMAAGTVARVALAQVAPIAGSAAAGVTEEAS